MTTFDNRENAFEEEFAHNEELAFRIIARRNKLLGYWAAEKMGMSKDKWEDYSKMVLFSDFERAGDDDVLEKVERDFKKMGMQVDPQEIRYEMNRLIYVARDQIMQSDAQGE